MAVVSVSMPETLIEHLDAFVAANAYAGRSDLIREGTRTLLTEFDDEALSDRPLTGFVACQYPFGSQRIDSELAELRHEHGAIVTTTNHTHVADRCLEVFIVEGDLEAISLFIGQVRSIERLETVEYSLTPLDELE